MASTQSHNDSRANTTNNTDQQVTTKTNIRPTERWFSAIGGGSLIAYGIIRRDWLGAGVATVGAALTYRGIAGRSALYKALKINDVGPDISANVSHIPGRKGVRVHRSQTIQRSAEDLYSFWRNIELAPLYMPGIDTVTITGERTSHWATSHNHLEWNSEILVDKPSELISWHVHGETSTANAGQVHFQPAAEGRGTIVTLELDFFQPDHIHKLAGPFEATIAEYETLEILRRFKEIMEAGEIPTIQGQSTGKGRK
jgi:uncharacterized membrane protein